MKKILLVMFIFIFSITVLGCDTEGGNDSTNPQEIWEKFDNSLQLTSALQYYSIETVEVINGEIVKGKLIYSTDDFGKTIAYKEKGNSKSWWYDGLTYFEEEGQKLKRASSINEFLEISDSNFNWTYEMASDLKMKKSVISFTVSLGENNIYKVESKIGKIFLEEITISISIVKNGDTINKSLTYKYINPGKKPEVSLPENINEYRY